VKREAGRIGVRESWGYSMLDAWNAEDGNALSPWTHNRADEASLSVRRLIEKTRRIKTHPKKVKSKPHSLASI
jgi:hypothetical protein